jgi:CheY-like chemotaxis protein
MGGRELAQVLKQERPETRVLFTSGYPDSGGMALDVAESRVPYLPKPYTPNELAQKVREVLDSAERAVDGGQER